MYVITRKDLSFPQQAVQAIHAAIDAARFSLISPDEEHPSVVLCTVKGETQLKNSLDQIQKAGIRCRAFHEPDIGNLLTAIATEPVSGEHRSLFKKYQLLKGGENV